MSDRRHRLVCLPVLLLNCSLAFGQSHCDLAKAKGYVSLPRNARYVPGEVVVRFVRPVTSREPPALPPESRLQGSYCVGGSRDCVYLFPATCLGGDPPAVARALKQNIMACAEDSRPGLPMGDSTQSVKDVFVNAVLRAEPQDRTYAPGGMQCGDELQRLSQMRALGVEAAWQRAKTRDDIITAILDSGIDLHHPEFANGQLVKGFQLPCQIAPCDGSPALPHKHGTAMGGIIGAARGNGGIVGVAWNTKMMSITTPAGEAMPDTIFSEAIQCALERGARVLNVSFGTPSAPSITADTLNRVNSEGANYLLIAAAGNATKNLADFPSYPPSMLDPETGKRFPNLIVVMSHNNAGGFDGSSWGIGIVDIAAPGKTYAAIPCGGAGNCYGNSSSSSSNATAYVSGAIALLWSAYPDWNYESIKWRLLQNASDAPDLQLRLQPARRLNVAAMMLPVRFTKATKHNKVHLADLGQVEPNTQLASAFPPGMCTDTHAVVVPAAADDSAAFSAAIAPQVGDLIRIAAICNRSAGNPYLAHSVEYAVIE